MNKNVLQLAMVLMVSHSIAWGMDLPNVFPAILPQDQFVEVLSYCNEERDWARLRMVCTWFNQNLSIKNPSLEIIQHKAFRTGQENVQSLAFNAAWNGNLAVLMAMIKHMQQTDYDYIYPMINSQTFTHFDLLSIIKVKMANKQEEIAEEAKKNNCELEFYNYGVENCTPIKMACYNRESLGGYEKPPYNMLWRRLISIAIKRNANTCIDDLCKRTITKEEVHLDELLKNNEYYQAIAKQVKKEKAELFLRILKFTMNLEKYSAFEIVVENDPFDCLNFVYEHSVKTAIRRSVLDRLIVFSYGKPEQQRYIEIYKEYGGKTNKELTGLKMQGRCVIL